MLRQYLIWTLGLMGLLVVAVWWEWPDNYLHVTACDVGQGDGAVVSKGFSQIVVDTGPENRAILSCLGRQVPFWDRRLELVVITHPQDDHMGSLVEILDRYRVGAVMVSVVDLERPGYQRLSELVYKGQVRLVEAVPGTVIKIDGMQWRVLWPDKSGVRVDQQLRLIADTPDVEDVNELSVTMLLEYGQFRGLFTGDIDTEIEKDLVGRGMIPAVTYLKVAHHGSKNSSSEAFLKAARPKIAVVSAGKNNQYGHPHADVLNRLAGGKMVVRRTDLEGDVEVVSDGGRYW